MQSRESQFGSSVTRP
nr:unnamed protein product [Callosobruchus chinensis]